MTALSQGGNAPVADPAARMEVAFSGAEGDVTAYLLGANGKVRSDTDMVFYNQPTGAGGAVRFEPGPPARFDLDLSAMPGDVAKVVVCLTLDGGRTFAALSACRLGLLSKAGEERLSFAPTTAGASEAAMMLAELYRHGGGWKLRAVGQGFNGGLAPLARSFGIDVADEPATAPAAAASTPGSPPKPVVLTKPGQTSKIDLRKGMTMPLLATAHWFDNGDDSDENDDLDLRVGILPPSGPMTYVHAPHLPGALDQPPFVRHRGDVKVAGAAGATETVEVNPRLAELSGGRVALVFSVYSAVGNGAVSVASLKPRMSLAFGDQRVDCAFDFLTKGPAATRPDVYTYVLGTAVFDAAGVTLQPSGLTSDPGSEATPLLSWRGSDLRCTLDGPPDFKPS